MIPASISDADPGSPRNSSPSKKFSARNDRSSDSMSSILGGDLRQGKTRYSLNDMCGLAGIYAGPDRRPARSLLLAMAGELRHRGPNGTGLLLDGRVGIAGARLGVLAPGGGEQPLSGVR